MGNMGYNKINSWRKGGFIQLLNVENLKKTYKGKTEPAVSDLSFSVKKGEIFGFLGPNGAGKTTTIKMIIGLLRPDSGAVNINGINALDNPVEAKRQIGYVADEPQLYRRLTGEEYLNFVADAHGVSGQVREERIKRFLKMFNLENAVSDLIDSYSHGMQQKLALTAALIHDPPLFILDEPMVGLDPKSANLFKGLMAQHCDEGNSVFFSTHVLEVAERVCDRVGIILNGKLIACGTMEELLKTKGDTLEKVFLTLTEEGGSDEKEE